MRQTVLCRVTSLLCLRSASVSISSHKVYCWNPPQQRVLLIFRQNLMSLG
jgi:hypothetical protein